MAAAAALMALMLPLGCNPPDVTVEESPIKITGETIGRGPEAQVDDVVCIDYRVLLPDGSELLKDQDFCFTLGAGAVIAGIDDAIPGMRVGGKRVVKCPPHKHWGSAGYGGGTVPPNTTLTLHIRLVSVD